MITLLLNEPVGLLRHNLVTDFNLGSSLARSYNRVIPNIVLFTNMVRTEYSAVRKTEVRGFFVSLVQAFVVLFLLTSLVIALIVVAALLAHERGKEKHAGGTSGDPKDSGKRDI